VTVKEAEEKLNMLLHLINPDLHSGAKKAKEWLRDQNNRSSHISSIWGSVFHCLSVISNGITPPHTDKLGSPRIFDLLVSCGNAEDAVLRLPEINVTLKYPPRTAIFIYGRTITHEVPRWKQGKDRCAWAHFIREALLRRVGVDLPQLVNIKDFRADD
jgi:hypothetical protein